MKKKQTNKNRDFEKIEKENATLYTNARTLFGEKGQEVIDDVMKAFDFALKATEEELSKKKGNPMDRINKIIDEASKNPLYKSVSDGIRAGVEELKELAQELANEVKSDEDTDKAVNEKHTSCKQCGGNCSGQCKCQCDSPCECHDKECTVNYKNSCDTLIENDKNGTESRSANFIRRRHLNYMNSLSDHNSCVDTPLPDALKRVAKQAADAVDEIDMRNTSDLNLSATEKEFVMPIVDRLIKVLDANFSVPEVDQDDNEYNDYDLPDFQSYDDVLEHDGFRFTGIMDDMEEPFGVALKVDLSKYSNEIAHRLLNDVDNGRLIELVAAYAGFDADNVFFESCDDPTTDMGELFFILED